MLTATGQLDEGGPLAAGALVSAKAGDAMTNGVRAAGGSPFGDLDIEGGKLGVLEANSDLRTHGLSLARVNQLVCVIDKQTDGSPLYERGWYGLGDHPQAVPRVGPLPPTS